MRSFKRLSVLSATFFVLLQGAAAISAPPEGPVPAEFKKYDGGFATKDDQFVIDAGAGSGGRLASLKEYEPGQYVVTGEYKTEGMEALSRFAVDLQSSDGKTAMSAYEFASASPEWAPLVLYATVETKGVALLRVANWQKCKGAESKLYLRNLQVKAQEWTDGMNLLVNGDFEQGTVGYLPANWYWKVDKSKKELPGANYALASNTSYKTGKHVLQLTVGADDDSLMLNGRSYNMPQAGNLELTYWAKAAKTCKFTPRIVQSWSKQYTLTTHEISDAWKQYTVKYSIVPDPKRKFFFLRLDVPSGQDAKIEIADMKLIYRAPSGSVSKPAAKAEESK